MRRRLILHETDFFTNRFSLPTLSMVEYSSEYLLFISYSTTCFLIDWVHVYNQGLRFKRNCIIARKQKRDKTWHVVPIVVQNKPHAHLYTMKLYNPRPVSLAVEVLLIKINSSFSTTEVFTCCLNTPIRIFVSFSKLGWGRPEFNSTEMHQYLAF